MEWFISRKHFSSNNGFTPRPPLRQGGNPRGPYRNRYNNGRRNNRGYSKNNYRRNNFNNFNGDKNNNSSNLMDTGTLISIILMDTETAVLEDTWTIILMTLINTTSKEDSTVAKVMEIL